MTRYLIYILIIGLTACTKEINTEEDFQPDVPYGTDTRQKMDIYLPADRSTSRTKVLVLIHGGGWSEGDKNDFTASIPQIQQMLPDYAIFSLNYRLANSTGTNLFPAQENDIQAALTYIHSRLQQYQLSDKIVLMGASAGAHLALLQAYKHATPVRPKAVVSLFGPTDLTALYNSGLLQAVILAQVTGSTPAANAMLYKQSSPLEFVTSQSPPTLLFHGGQDNVVPPAQSQVLKNALDAAGVTNQYVFYHNEAHGWTGTNLTDTFEKVVAFLATNVK